MGSDETEALFRDFEIRSATNARRRSALKPPHTLVVVPFRTSGAHVVPGRRAASRCDHTLDRWAVRTPWGDYRYATGACSRPCEHGVVLLTRDFELADKAQSGVLFSAPAPRTTRIDPAWRRPVPSVAFSGYGETTNSHLGGPIVCAACYALSGRCFCGAP